MRLDQIPSPYLREMLRATERDPYGSQSAEIIRRALEKRLELESRLGKLIGREIAHA